MTLTLVPRAAILLPEPPATRTRLRAGIKELLCHYTGVNGYPANPLRDLEYGKSVAYYGQLAGKPYEYNYLIGPGGTVFVQAGEFAGAHCKAWNGESIGVLFMLGVGVQPTPEMIASFHALRVHLMATGALAKDHRVLPHYNRRATACCGQTLAEAPQGRLTTSPTGEGAIGDVLPFLLTVVSVPAPAPLPPSTPSKEKHPVFTGIVKLDRPDAPWFACYTDGTKKWIAPNSGNEFRALLQLAGYGTEVGIFTDVELFRALGPVVGPVPAGCDAWGAFV